MSKSSFESSVLAVSTQTVWELNVVSQDFRVQFSFDEGMIHIYFMFSERVYPKGIFLSEAFMLPLSGRFKYHHFSHEKTPVWASSDLHMEAHPCLFTGYFPFLLRWSQNTNQHKSSYKSWWLHVYVLEWLKSGVLPEAGRILKTLSDPGYSEAPLSPKLSSLLWKPLCSVANT